MENTLVLVGNDKKGREFIAKYAHEFDILIALETGSRVLKRIFKLLKRDSLNLNTLLKMTWAEILRKDFKISKYSCIKNNKDLILFIKNNKINRIILYHVGIIISKKVIQMGIHIWNIHCAQLPEYGGLMAIERAINNRDFNQEVTLHTVIENVDAGSKIFSQPYDLNSNRSYRFNENAAFAAGEKLLLETLDQLDLRKQ